MAVYCKELPVATVAFGGEIVIDTSVAGVTVSAEAVDVTPSSTALITVLPAVAVVAAPLDPAALLTVATAGTLDAQVT